MVIDDSEKEDFESVILKKGLDIFDFEMTVEQNSMQRTAEVQKITGSVKIARKSTGKEKAYQAGHGTRWVVDFFDDLNDGVFG
jgi:hypothetical protein